MISQGQPVLFAPGLGVSLSGQHPFGSDSQGHPSLPGPRAAVVLSGQQPNSEVSHSGRGISSVDVSISLS